MDEHRESIISRIISGFSERNRVAREIRGSRRREYGNWTTHRDLEWYEYCLNGIRASIGYIHNNRRQLGTDKIVDVGCGDGFATREISQNYSHGLEVFATNLSYPSFLEKFLPKGHIHVTSAEVMRGFEDNSVGLIISVLAAAYSDSPRMVIRRFNEILAPGGVLKIVCRNTGIMGRLSWGLAGFPAGLKTYSPFVSELKKLGYREGEDYTVNRNDGTAVILAIKPANIGISAKTLMQDDFNTWKGGQQK